MGLIKISGLLHGFKSPNSNQKPCEELTRIYRIFGQQQAVANQLSTNTTEVSISDIFNTSQYHFLGI